MVTVTTVEELRSVLLTEPKVSIQGQSTGKPFKKSEGVEVQVGLSGVISHEADDQVVTAWGNTPIRELQSVLKERGQCLPWLSAQAQAIDQVQGTLAGQLSLNLPHSFEFACGTWRDWVLGLKLMLADGTTAKTGSKAVKNVAGYDVQRLLIGAMGQLAVITEVTLRTYPIRALPAPDFYGLRDFPSQGYVHRVPLSQFAAASTAEDVFASHPQTGTLYRTTLDRRFSDDWILPWGHSNQAGQRERAEKSSVQTQYETRAKAIFDPEGRLR